MRRTVAALVLVTVLAGCGSDGDSLEPAPTQQATEPTEPKPISVPWRLDSVDGTLLELEVLSGACLSFQNVEVVETAAAVTITALGVPGETTCTAELAAEQVPTPLEKPLGERKLVHAAVDPSVAKKQTVLGPDTR